MLAPSSILESEFRAQVFASMRFSASGPEAEAKLLRGKLASQGVHLHIISLLAGESITRSVFDTMAKCDAFIAMATKDVRGRVSCHLCALTSPPRAVWTRHRQPRGDVSRSARVEGGARARGQAADPAAHGALLRFSPRVRRPAMTSLLRHAQIPWEKEFKYPTARELFGSNLLVLTWIKGEPLPAELVGDILKAIGLERETSEQRATRRSTVAAPQVGSMHRRSSIERRREEEPDSDSEDTPTK